jgi:hypothetical protein
MHRIRLAALTLLTACVGYGEAPGYATIYTFKGGQDGASPNGVVLGKNGDLYGTTYTGGVNECGVNVYFWCGSVFQLTPAEGGTWTKTIIFSFNGADGALPSQPYEDAPGPRPIFGANGALYGTTENGGQYDSAAGDLGGTVFELTPPSSTGAAWTETALYSFQNNPQAPHAPYGGLLLTSTGALLGTTFTNFFSYQTFEQGGTAFELIPPAESGASWTLNNLIDFLTADIGMDPAAGVMASGGSLYGTLSNAAFTCGSVYELSPPTSPGGAWSGQAIYTFGGPPGPCFSIAPLTVGPGGVLYGTTYIGGSGSPSCTPSIFSGCGTVFQLTPPMPGGTWTESVLYSFTASGGDGAFPAAGVILGKNGVLYGTTTYGGSATSGSSCNSGAGATGCGTVFQLTPPAVAGGPWTETILHSFTGQNGDGSIPGPLTLSPKGVLFGPARSGGGTDGAGTIFALVP